MFDPQIKLLSCVKIDWKEFNTTVSHLDKRPDRELSQYPVSFTDDTKYLLYLANLNGISLNNPTSVLNNLPNELLEYLHYTFMVACDRETYVKFAESSRLQIVPVETGDMYLLLVAGTFFTWYNTITLSLLRKESLLINKFLIHFEQNGLKEIFSKYKKVIQINGTFLLEHK